MQNGVPAIPVYVFTDIGIGLSTILPSNQESIGMAYAAQLKSIFPDGSVSVWAILPDGRMAMILVAL